MSIEIIDKIRHRVYFDVEYLHLTILRKDLMSQISVIETPIHDLAAARTQLSFAVSSDVPTTAALAESLGLFNEEFGSESDLDFSVERFGFGYRELLTEGGFWIREGDHASALWERSKGHDSRLIGLSWIEGTYPVVAITGSGIRSISELKGKRLGIIKTTESPFDVGYAQQLKIYTTALSTAKLTLDDVELVPIERSKIVSTLNYGNSIKHARIELNTNLAARLRRGEFDAISVPLASDIAHHISVRILSDTQDHHDFIARVHPGVLRAVVVSGALLRKRRHLVVRALARLLEAADWAKRRTAEQLAAKLPKVGELDPEALVSKYDGLPSGLQVDFSAEKILGLRAQKSFLLRHQLIAKNFALDEWIDQGPFAEAHKLYSERRESSRRSASR